MSELPVYTPTNWVDRQAPALDKDNLNKLEGAVKAVTDRAIASVRYDAAQVLSPTQQAIAQANLGVSSSVQSVTPGDSTVAVGGSASAPTVRIDLANPNTWTGKQTFGVATGTAFDYTGGLDAANAAGTLYRASAGISAVNGINDPTRGDGLTSDAGNGAGASFFSGHYLNFGTFSSKGSLQGHAVYGTLGANASYGEAAGFVCSLTGARAGGLIEGVEATVVDGSGSQARAACFVGIMKEDNASITYWSRGIWMSSQGTNAAGDAYYADGASGWKNFLNFKHTDGTTNRLRVDSTGKLFIGTNSRNLYDAGTALQTDTSFTSGGSIYAATSVQCGGVYLNSDNSRFISWGTGAPNGVVTASPGAVYLNLSGGAATTLYVKESGTGNTGWVAK